MGPVGSPAVILHPTMRGAVDFPFRSRLLPLVAVWSVLSGLAGAEPVVLESQAYRLEVSADEIVVSRRAMPAVVRKIRCELTLQFSADNPGYTQAGAEGTMRVAAWKPAESAAAVERNFWGVGAPVVVHATQATLAGRTVELKFPSVPSGQLTLHVRLDEGTAPPVFEWRLTARQAGWFSVGFTGLTARDPAKLDFLYQPLVWSWKRFPVSPVLTPESFATTAAVWVNGDGHTEGLAPDLAEIPYRFATWENSRFGLALRDAAGNAKPTVFAPLLGGADSRLAIGDTRSFAVRYFLQPGDWYAGLTYFYRAIAGYGNERQNATCSLNETFENMIDYAMDDTLSGWSEELKGSDYRFDVPGTVKNVAGSHALSVALTTGDREIYRRRARPMIEYLLSREKYLYATSDQIKMQSPSHFLRGPAVELGELAALHELTAGAVSVFASEARRILGQPRQLNLTTVSSGTSWQDYLAAYRITRDPTQLRRARELADAFLAESVWQYPRDFQTSPGLRDAKAAFMTDFTPPLYDLIELHEETGEPRCLEAALLSARQMLLWLRSNPMAPAGTILANPGGRVPGVFPGRRHKADSYEFKPFETSTDIPEQRVPAWRTSLVGLPPEQPYTYSNGPIMLAHHAAWLLRLAQLGHDPLLGEAASNAVIGRYANFPGYYFNSLATTVYQRADYPRHPYFDVKYNAIFYNHIWPHIALLQDYLVSEADAKSHGAVHFPSAYAPGYAYLSSKVYGHRSGEIFGETGVRLWLPPHALRSSTVALNHLFGIGAEATYVVLSNTSSAEVAADLALDADVLHLDAGRDYPLTIFRADAAIETGLLRQGRLLTSVPPYGLVAVKINGLNNRAALPALPPAVRVPSPAAETSDYFRQPGEGRPGTVTGMILRWADQTDAYLYTDLTEQQASRITLHYRLDDAPEVVVEDDRYPFEFSVPVVPSTARLRLRLRIQDLAGAVTDRPLPDLVPLVPPAHP